MELYYFKLLKYEIIKYVKFCFLTLCFQLGSNLATI